MKTTIENELVQYKKLEIVAKQLGVSNVKIKDLIKDKLINFKNISGQYFVIYTEVEYFFKPLNMEYKSFDYSDTFEKVAKITYRDVNVILKTIDRPSFKNLQKSLRNILETKSLNLQNIIGLVEYIIKEEKYKITENRIKNLGQEFSTSLSVGKQSMDDIANEHYLMYIEILKFFNIHNFNNIIVIDIKK